MRCKHSDPCSTPNGANGVRRYLYWLALTSCVWVNALQAAEPTAAKPNAAKPPAPLTAPTTAASDKTPVNKQVVAPPSSPTSAPATPTAATSDAPQSPSEETPAELSEADAELAAQPVSNAARVRMERARESVVQIRGFFGDSQSDAFHGSGFAVTNDGLIVTNYHVVSDAVLYPKQYRLEFLSPNGASGVVRVYAVDLEHDLAIVKAENFTPPPLRLRTQIPVKGERAYSIGFPLNLGLTITEGVANGLIENTLEQRIHYSGAMNGGMSGGPALDNYGAVYGVNVAVFTSKQSVSFVVPAKHIVPLISHAKQPLDLKRARDEVGKQLKTHQEAMFATLPKELPTQKTNGYVLPGKLSASVECNSDGTADPNKPLRVEAVGCSERVAIYVEGGLDVGELYYQHRILETDKLHPLQFFYRVNRLAEGVPWSGSDTHVAKFACRSDIVKLKGFDARVSTCVRQYRMFADLHDIGVSVVSLNSGDRAMISNLFLRGVDFDAGMDFARRYVGVMQWKP